MDDRLFHPYIVASRTRVLYIGITGNLMRRIAEHRQRTRAGFTARYRCDRLVWFEAHPHVLSALQREKELKGWTRAKKIQLIESANPTWEDLSSGWGEPSPGLTRDRQGSRSFASLRMTAV